MPSQEDLIEEYHDENEEYDEEEEEEEDDDQQVKKTPLMEESELTDEQRRKLRKQQRNLLKEMADRDDLQLEEARGRNNELFDRVRYTREAVLDGENLIVIANKAAKQVDRLIQVPRYDADRLVSKLVQKCRSSTRSSTFFDWIALGSEAGICFNAIPSRVSFLNGPLQDGETLQVKQRVQRQRPVEQDTTEEAKPEDVQAGQTKDCDQLSAVEQSMKVLEKVLHKQVKKTYTNNKKRLLDEHDGELPPEVNKRLKKHGTDLCAIQYLFNPTSFTQTVENIFHYSFLIKKGSAQIALREKLSEFGPAGPVVKYKDDKTANRPQPKQCIASLTMKDWRELCAGYQVEKGDVPNRTGSKQHKGRGGGATQTQTTTQPSQLSQESASH